MFQGCLILIFFFFLFVFLVELHTFFGGCVRINGIGYYDGPHCVVIKIEEYGCVDG